MGFIVSILCGMLQASTIFAPSKALTFAFASRSLNQMVSFGRLGPHLKEEFSYRSTKMFGSNQHPVKTMKAVHPADSYSQKIGSNLLMSFGGLTFNDTPETLQRVVFVLGGPGSGKGTQSDLMLKNYPCVHLSVGELLRAETAKADSPHAGLIEECLVSGKIVPVEISLALLQEAMNKRSKASLIFLVDGFPRNFDNLDGWVRCMTDSAMVKSVLVYNCPLDVLEGRILERSKVSGRTDDNLESLRKRFSTFESDTKPVIEALRHVSESSCMAVHNIEANHPVDEVWKETQLALNSIIADDVLAKNWKLLEAVSAGDDETYRSLCADEMFDSNSSRKVMEEQEAKHQNSAIQNADLSFLSGKKVHVTYECLSGSTKFRESRVWSHQESGWKMVHFSRCPLY